jgi:hypothetical protein
MKIERHTIERISIEDFADKHNLTLELHERTDGTFFVHFMHADVKEGDCLLVGKYGDGQNEDFAIQDYCKEISNETLVISAFSKKDRREIRVPRLFYKIPAFPSEKV